MRKILLLLFLICQIKSFATHIVGGEITYTYLGNFNYEIRLLVYRDCFNGLAGFDLPAKITVYDDASQVLDVIDIGTFTQVNLPNTINNPCITAPSNICYQRAEYVIPSQFLPPIQGGYYLVYQRCCRNGTIVNLNNPGDQGATFMEHIPGLETNAWQNSSPRYSSLPPTFLCSSTFFNYDHSAIDIDGDSLVYEFCKAYKGLDICCPLIQNLGNQSSPNSSNTSGCIVPLPTLCPIAAYPPIAYGFASPNYDSVNYGSNYNSNTPFGITSAITISPTTGFISGTPNLLGQYVVAVCAKEYRNGVLIGLHRREYQFNVTPCIKTIVSSIITPSILCKNSVAFSVNTTYSGPNFVAYTWDFGDIASGVSNTSSLANPSHAFTDTGFYTITLTTYDALVPSCNDITTKVIKVINPVSAAFSSITPICKNTPVPFTINSISNINNFGINYVWNFNNPQSGINNTANITNPFHSFTDTGTYNVTLTINVPANPGCGNTIVKPIKVSEYVKPNFTFPNTICKNQPVAITNTSFGSSQATPLAYSWQFNSANLLTSSSINPTVQFSNTGTYTISLVSNSTNIIGCKDSITKSITIQSLELQPNVPTNLCNSLTVPFNVNSNLGGIINYQWDFGDQLTTTDVSNNQTSTYTYPTIGNYTYTVKGVSSTNNFCRDSITGVVKILDIISPNFSSVIPFCANLPVKLIANSSHLGLGNLSYTWQAIPNNQNGDSVYYAFPDSGIYNVLLVASNSLYANCKASITKPIKINPRLVAAISIDSLYCKSFNEVIKNFSRGSKYPVYNWYFNLSNNNPFSLIKEPLIDITDTGQKSFFLIYKDSTHLECADTTNTTIRIAPLPTISITTTSEKCGGGDAAFGARVINTTGRKAFVYWQLTDGSIDSGFQITHTFPKNSNYIVYAATDVPSLKNCSNVSDSITINISGRGELFIPNTFSPNNDENNDVFKVEGPPFQSFYLIVYNRFGEKVFESKDQNLGWDGKIKNTAAEPGVFGYYLEVKCPDGAKQVKKGNVTLLR